MSVISGTCTPTFWFRYPSTHQCVFAPVWCTNDEYQGGTCRGHVAGYMCVGEDEGCENGLVMLPDWGGPHGEPKRELK